VAQANNSMMSFTVTVYKRELSFGQSKEKIVENDLLD